MRPIYFQLLIFSPLINSRFAKKILNQWEGDNIYEKKYPLIWDQLKLNNLEKFIDCKEIILIFFFLYCVISHNPDQAEQKAWICSICIAWKRNFFFFISIWCASRWNYLQTACFKQPRETEKLKIHNGQWNWQSMEFILLFVPLSKGSSLSFTSLFLTPGIKNLKKKHKNQKKSMKGVN